MAHTRNFSAIREAIEAHLEQQSQWHSQWKQENLRFVEPVQQQRLKQQYDSQTKKEKGSQIGAQSKMPSRLEAAMKGKKTRSYALISSDEIFEKWEKGLCELCDELYVPGHKCKKVSSDYVIVVVDEEEDMRQPDFEVEDPPAVDAHQVLDESPKSNPDISSDDWVGEGQGKTLVGSQNDSALDGLMPLSRGGKKCWSHGGNEANGSGILVFDPGDTAEGSIALEVEKTHPQEAATDVDKGVEKSVQADAKEGRMEALAHGENDEDTNKKCHLSTAFSGHVDSGKSPTTGHWSYKLGGVDSMIEMPTNLDWCKGPTLVQEPKRPSDKPLRLSLQDCVLVFDPGKFRSPLYGRVCITMVGLHHSLVRGRIVWENGPLKAVPGAGKKGSAILIHTMDQPRAVRVIARDVRCRFKELPPVTVRKDHMKLVHSRSPAAGDMGLLKLGSKRQNLNQMQRKRLKSSVFGTSKGSIVAGGTKVVLNALATYLRYLEGTARDDWQEVHQRLRETESRNGASFGALFGSALQLGIIFRRTVYCEAVKYEKDRNAGFLSPFGYSTASIAAAINTICSLEWYWLLSYKRKLKKDELYCNRLWRWNGHLSQYTVVGDDGPAVLLVHGFGASHGHYPNNLCSIAEDGKRVWAITPPAIDFVSSEGKKLFIKAVQNGTMEGFYKLIFHFQTQSKPAYCGLASLSMVLNALAIDPGRTWKRPWRWFDESTLDCCEPLEKVKAKGISAGKIACLAHCAGAVVQTFRTNESSTNEFRNYVKACSQVEDVLVVSSYHRGIFKQTGYGHFSTIGGYHVGRDMALILDVARFKYPPHWVPLTLLWEAMDTIDEASGKNRGYMLIFRQEQEPALLFTLSCKHQSWESVAKYLIEDIPSLLKSASMKDVEEAISVVCISLPSNFRDSIKWVAEVRRTEDNGGSLSKAEIRRLMLKEELLKQTKFLSSAYTCARKGAKLGHEETLSDVAAADVHTIYKLEAVRVVFDPGGRKLVAAYIPSWMQGTTAAPYHVLSAGLNADRNAAIMALSLEDKALKGGSIDTAFSISSIFYHFLSLSLLQISFDKLAQTVSYQREKGNDCVVPILKPFSQRNMQ